MSERRKWKRYMIAYPIENVEGYTEQSLTLCDVSKGGVAFFTEKKMFKNDKIDLQLFLKSKMFSIKGAVVHVKTVKRGEYVIGVKFIETPENFIKILEKEIEEVMQFFREGNLYDRKGLTFRKASTEYLET
ncbi:MAG: PilZ domain-containing protein [Candidatus Omnitrophota bacterium]|nr:PilZ domain-containing protein [Candidatus Omnitrophota bacterium]